VNANSPEEVKEILETMPLIDYMDPTIYELAFHNMAGTGLPAISLN
jgi:muconolactone delta-isomerase